MKKVVVSLIIIIVILVLGLGVSVGLLLNRAQNQENKTQVENVSKTENKTNNETNKEQIENKQLENKQPEKTIIETKEMNADERFAIYSKGIQSNIEKLSKSISEENRKNYGFSMRLFAGDTYNSTDDFPVGQIYINDKKELYIAIKEIGDQIKLMDNAINCGICETGNGGNTYTIWAVDVNGNLYSQDYDTTDTANRMKFSLTRKTEFKNVVSVIQCINLSAAVPLVVDIDGNISLLD